MRAEDRSGGADDGNLLPYAPGELFSGLVTIHLGMIAFGPTWQYVSHRYALPSNAPESLLGHYIIVGAGVSGTWPLGPVDLVARLEGANLFDAEYQVIRNYPMPGRSGRLSLELRYVSQ
jgi:outer membrane cobalamin receptor